MDIGRWATVVGLSMTPALFAGQSAAAAAGIAFGFTPLRLVGVIAVSGLIEGLLVAWIGGATRHVGFIEARLAKLRTPRAMSLAARWGVWGGLSLGVAVVGQEPILLALRALGVDMKRLLLPLALSNALFAAVYYFVVRFGIDKLLSLNLF